MTLYKLLDKVTAIEGVNFELKRMNDQMMLLLKKENDLIADVFIDKYEYNKDYLKLYHMNLYDMFEVDQALYDFTQTPVKERGLQLL